MTQLKEAINDFKTHIRESWKIWGPLVQEVKEAQLMLVASSLAYTTLLSIVPLLAVSLSVFHMFGGMENLYETIEPLIISNLAASAGDTAKETLRAFIQNIHAGALGGTGLIALLFTSMSMLASAEKAINRVWKTEVKRSLFQRITTYWFFITLGPLSMAFIVGATSSASLSYTKILPTGAVGFLTLTAIFSFIYKTVPHRPVHFFPAVISGFFTATLWTVAKSIYALYTSQVLTYNKIYGSLAAIPIVILWIYIIWLVILCGAGVGAILQKRVDQKQRKKIKK